MTFKVIQKIPAIEIASVGGVSTSIPISMKTGYIRITPEQSAYIEVGPNPGINTSTSIWVPGGESIIIKEEWGSKSFVGVQTGTTTTIIFADGTGGGFALGEYVSVSGVTPAGVNTNFTTVSAVDNRSSYDSYYGSKLSVNWNTTSQGPVTIPAGELRKVTKVAAYNAGTGSNKIHITEIQVNAYA
jgi:hypothetical protein